MKNIRLNIHNGFTLVELLISILILGVVGSTAIISIHAVFDKNIDKEARRLVNVLEIERAKARGGGSVLFFEVNSTGYKIYNNKKNSHFILWDKGLKADEAVLVLGPDAILPQQWVVLSDENGNKRTIYSDGVRSFFTVPSR